jgi:hypothetical protein
MDLDVGKIIAAQQHISKDERIPEYSPPEAASEVSK